MKKSVFKITLLTLLCAITLGSFNGFAQNDSIPETKKIKKEKKKKDEFKVMAGFNFNNMSLSSNSLYESPSDLGYLIGAKYKRGKFFYWEAGARYNSARYTLKQPTILKLMMVKVRDGSTLKVIQVLIT